MIIYSMDRVYTKVFLDRQVNKKFLVVELSIEVLYYQVSLKFDATIEKGIYIYIYELYNTIDN